MSMIYVKINLFDKSSQTIILMYFLCVPVSLAHLVRDNAYYMQGPGFEPRTPHLFTLR